MLKFSHHHSRSEPIEKILYQNYLSFLASLEVKAYGRAYMNIFRELTSKNPLYIKQSFAFNPEKFNSSFNTCSMKIPTTLWEIIKQF